MSDDNTYEPPRPSHEALARERAARLAAEARAETAERKLEALRAEHADAMGGAIGNMQEAWLELAATRERLEALRAGIVIAFGELSHTRWNPSGDLKAYNHSIEGRTFKRVTAAMNVLRALLDAGAAEVGDE